jgi:hypothetical protein
MPIEIRELVIKTEVSISGQHHPAAIQEKDLQALKKQVLEACKRLITEQVKRNSYKR